LVAGALIFSGRDSGASVGGSVFFVREVRGRLGLPSPSSVGEAAGAFSVGWGSAVAKSVAGFFARDARFFGAASVADETEVAGDSAASGVSAVSAGFVARLRGAAFLRGATALLSEDAEASWL
jgi:hypothetical protein